MEFLCFFFLSWFLLCDQRSRMGDFVEALFVGIFGVKGVERRETVMGED